MTQEWVLRHPSLARVRHGFFTRLGGVSEGPYASLNCSMRSGDVPEALAENRARVAREMGVAATHLMGVTQVHGDGVAVVADIWDRGPEADAMVTTRTDVALGVITADCGPVLFMAEGGAVVGAAHAGWRGAVGGVIEATLDAMAGLGARRETIVAVVGPCITQSSYEVGPNMRDAALALDALAEGYFEPGARAGHFQFDLPGYCVARLQRAGVSHAAATGVDTMRDEQRFFSHRRRTLAGGGQIGHQISVIAAYA